MGHQRDISPLNCKTPLISERRRVSLSINRLQAKRQPKNSAVTAKPIFHNIEKLIKLTREANDKSQITEFMRKIELEIAKEQELKKDIGKGEAEINIETTPSIFNTATHRNKIRIRTPKRFSQSVKLNVSPMISSPNSKPRIIVDSYKKSKKISNSGVNSISTISNASTAVQASRLKSLNSMIEVCSQAESSFHENDQSFSRRIKKQRTKSKDILQSIADLQECLDEIKTPCLLRDRLSTKQYNRMVDRVLLRKAPIIKQDCIDMSEYIASLGQHKIWKFSSPSISKRTEKLIYS